MNAPIVKLQPANRNVLFYIIHRRAQVHTSCILRVFKYFPMFQTLRSLRSTSVALVNHFKKVLETLAVIIATVGLSNSFTQ